MSQTMTAQEVFDTVVAHLRKQGRRAVDKKGDTCMYRAPNGDKCAAGCLILDEEYASAEENIECSTFKEAILRLPSSARARLRPHVELIGALQGIHDFLTVDRWEYRFFMTAQEYRLAYSEPST